MSVAQRYTNLANMLKEIIKIYKKSKIKLFYDISFLISQRTAETIKGKIAYIVTLNLNYNKLKA